MPWQEPERGRQGGASQPAKGRKAKKAAYYVDEIDVPVVPFALTSYWSSYYGTSLVSPPRLLERRFATRLTIDRAAARIGRAAAARGAALPEAKARVGVEERSRARVEERTRAGGSSAK